MKQKLFIFLFLILMVAILAGLNAASYTQREKTPDSEFMPNRSTFNSGTTGSQAFYSLLAETGHKVTRWQEPPAALLTASKPPAVFVVIGRVRRDFTDADVEQLLRWVSAGGRLVIVDREPPEELVTTTANWKIGFDTNEDTALLTVDITDQKQMTADTAAVKAIQPTIFTQGVVAVQPSRFASAIGFERFADGKDRQNALAGPPPPKKGLTRSRDPKGGPYTMPSPTPVKLLPPPVAAIESPSQTAPLAHFASGEKQLVVDAPFGNGRIVFLADPYVLSNGGIALADNAQLGVNLVSAGGEGIAFDEYHHGYGTDNNRFVQFFQGTPVVAIFLQAAVLIGLVFFSQSRRFARPVPEPEADRLSKLEYVAAMAQLQSRTRAFDLAIENIYNDFRRRVTRYFGLDNFTATSGDIAALIAERSGLDRALVGDTMFKCEEIIRGEPTTKREVLQLTDALRTIEQKLGLTRAARTKI